MSVFTLEAVFAKKGDALLLHYGDWADPQRILIDGGPGRVYESFLKPRLDQLREEFELEPDDAVTFEMVMVSHIDDDHVNGIIDFFEELKEAKDKNQSPPYAVKTLWHNSFDDIRNNDDEAIISGMAAMAASSRDPAGLPLPKKMLREAKAVVASTKQGRDLRNLAKTLKVNVNEPFKGLVMAPAEPRDLGNGLSFVVFGPLESRVKKFQARWDKDLKAILAKEKKTSEALSFSDNSPFNLASICVLAEMQGKRMLLTGDARGDFIIEGLEEAKLLKKTKPMHVDLLKLPHHGSNRNVTKEFFERVTADHYVVSGDGEHGNPEVDTLEMIAEARDREEYTIHFTIVEDAWKTEKNKKRTAALKAVQEWVDGAKPEGCTVVFREDDEEVLSVLIDLLDPLYEE